MMLRAAASTLLILAASGPSRAAAPSRAMLSAVPSAPGPALAAAKPGEGVSPAAASPLPVAGGLEAAASRALVPAEAAEERGPIGREPGRRIPWQQIEAEADVRALKRLLGVSLSFRRIAQGGFSEGWGDAGTAGAAPAQEAGGAEDDSRRWVTFGFALRKALIRKLGPEKGASASEELLLGALGELNRTPISVLIERLEARASSRYRISTPLILDLEPGAPRLPPP